MTLSLKQEYKGRTYTIVSEVEEDGERRLKYKAVFSGLFYFSGNTIQEAKEKLHAYFDKIDAKSRQVSKSSTDITTQNC